MMERHFQTNRIAQFTANKDAFKAVSCEIDSSVKSSIPQPVLIIGQEGSGKTTLLKRLISAYPHLHFMWIDGRSVFSTADIINRISDSDILIIDDFDYYLERCSYNEQFRLRRCLYNEGAPMLIASVKKLYHALTEYKAPFFEGLKKIHLFPISVEDIPLLFDEKTIGRAVTLFNLLSPTIKSVEIVSNIIATNSDSNKDINQLLSYFSDKYRLMYQSMPVNSQRILNILSHTEDGLMMPKIREESNLASGILTPYLKNICKQGYVDTDKSVKRKTVYFVRDPLFRIWLKETT